MEAEEIGSAEGQNFTYVLKNYIFAIDKKFELTSSFEPIQLILHFYLSLIIGFGLIWQ